MNRKLAILLTVITLCSACRKAPTPVPVPEPAPSATPATLPIPLPPASETPEASELPPPPAPEPEPMPAPASEAESPAPEAISSKADNGIVINENPPAPSSSPPEEKELLLNTAEIELELLLLINGLREKSGTEPLGLQEDMLYAARIRSAEALDKFSHTRPDGSPYNTAFDEAGFSYAGKWHGENLASLRFSAGQLDESAAALKLFEGLSESPGHRENMTRGNFAQTGVGVAAYTEGKTVTLASAQLFASF